MATVSVTSRYVIAKYVPDLDRMEPRNIGVFLWVHGRIMERFLEPDSAAGFVREMDVYSRWVTYWKKAISSGMITPRRGAPVPISAPESVDALLATQKGNYILADAGELMQSLRKKDAKQATDFLFRELVATNSEKPARVDKHGFADRCLAILKQSGISDREDFREQFEVKCPVYGVPQDLHFSYGIGNGHPEGLLQRVQLTNEQSVTSSAAKLHSLLIGSSILPRNRCRVLVSKKDINTTNADNGYKLLSSLCETVDVDADTASDELLTWLCESTLLPNSPERLSPPNDRPVADTPQ